MPLAWHISRWYYNEHNYRFSLIAFYFNHSQISLSYSVTGDMKEKTQNTSYLPRPEDRFTDLFSNKSSYISDLYHHPLIFPGSGEEGMRWGGGFNWQILKSGLDVVPADFRCWWLTLMSKRPHLSRWKTQRYPKGVVSFAVQLLFEIKNRLGMR